VREPGEKFEEARNSRVDHRSTREEFFLWRDHARPRKSTQTVNSPGPSFVHAAGAPPGHVSLDPRPWLAVYAAAWPLAIAAVHANSRAPGNTAASSGSPGISARSPCADRSAIEAVPLWSRYRLLLYARYVPREVVAPLGAARGGSQYPPRALTHSRSDPTEFPQRDPPPQHGERSKKDTRPLPQRGTESSANEADTEADGPDKIRLERKQRSRRSGQAA
jgi:hypothetical protein